MHITNIPKLPRISIEIPKNDPLAWLIAGIFAGLALILIATTAIAGEQTRFYDARGNSVGTTTRDSQGTTVFRDSRGTTIGSSSRPRR